MSTSESVVHVIADFSPSGVVTPCRIIWEDGRVFEIADVGTRMEFHKADGTRVMQMTVRIGRNLRQMRFDGARWTVMPRP